MDMLPFAVLMSSTGNLGSLQDNPEEVWVKG